VATDPLHIGTIYGGFETNGLWKSADCGATWTHVATGRNAQTIESGDVWEILVDPITSAVYVDSGYGGDGLYRSTNGGVDWDVITPTGSGIPNFVGSFSLDPTNHNHILVSFHDNCTGTYAPMCFAETLDGAATWQFVVGPAKAWGEGAGITAISGANWIYGAPFDSLYYTGDSGKTWAAVVGYPGCYSDLANASGNYYVGCLNSAIETIPTDQASLTAAKWMPVSNSPQATALGLTGTYLYTSFQNDTSGQPIHRAPRSGLTSWTTVATPTMSSGASPRNMPYDSTHGILYVAGWGAGLWRAVTP
jgi:hypothetical protein